MIDKLLLEHVGLHHVLDLTFFLFGGTFIDLGHGDLLGQGLGLGLRPGLDHLRLIILLDTKFNFGVKGKSDAHILFSNCPNCDGYEIVIGGWGNTQSALREGKQKKDTQQKVSTPNILSEAEWRRFWITYTVQGNTVTIA